MDPERSQLIHEGTMPTGSDGKPAYSGGADLFLNSFTKLGIMSVSWHFNN